MAPRSIAVFRVGPEEEARAGGGAELLTAALALASLACREASTRARRWAAEALPEVCVTVIIEVVVAAVVVFSAAANL